ncbi:glycosyltransferase [Kineosporia sp. A_224]|uniref:glycosyltransferase n=1 Tax=Kineosporia sp. A_224 TaxID=1962180 RepID=UPI0018EA0D42|nr:glycosyltransferase [Kineosporia sp. A_224]
MGVRVLMLVATAVANDTRVLREATALVRAGHAVHVVGFGVPPGFAPPDGVTVSSAGRRARASRPETPGAVVPTSAARRARPLWWRGARWLLLPEHRARAFGRWAREAYADATDRRFDVVHAHDFNTLELGDRLAREHGVPLVYDSHELWFGRPVVGRPTPLRDARGRRTEARLGSRADAVVTVGEGVAEALEDAYGWRDVRVVRNTFAVLPPPTAPLVPARLLYAGRLAPYRELEVVAAASRDLPLPVDILGPADETWLRDFDPGAARVLDAVPADEVSWLLRGAGVALVTHSDRWPNHRLAMPNKLFQAVAAGVPVVATDVGELATLVRGYRLGALYRPGDPASLVAAVADVLAGYDRYAAAVRVAAASLTWPADERMLLDVYAGLPTGPNHLTRSRVP